MSIELREKQKYFMEVVLNRPQLRNAFDPEMITKITEAFKKISSETHWRGIILKGEGKIFCAGADLKWMESMVHYTFDENEVDAQKLFAMFESIENCPHVVMSVVQGAAMGGALGLLAASDVVVAEQNAQFCFSEVKLGIAPAVISAFVLKKCTQAMVAPWMLTGRVFNAQQAQQMGLVTEIGEPSDAALAPWQTALLDAAPEAVRVTKALLRQVVAAPWSAQKKITAQAIAERRVSAEGQEGLKAFLNKAVPPWRKT